MRTASDNPDRSGRDCGGGWTVRLLGERPLLFSELDQAVYEIDPLTAYVSWSLESGVAPELIVADLVESGIGEQIAFTAFAETGAATPAVAGGADPCGRSYRPG